MAYTVRYERDESGWWIVSVPEVQGCRSQGRSIQEAKRRIREALSLYVEDAETADLVDDVVLPKAAKKAVFRMVSAKRKAEEATQGASMVARKTVSVLIAEYGISVRDAAKVLGVSHQRIQQIKRSDAPRSTKKQASG